MIDIPVIFIAHFIGLAYLAAISPKALGTSIVFGLMLVTLYPNTDAILWADLFLLPAFLLANFRD